jgi:hypothetical protein
MRVFKTKAFARFSKQEGITDDALCEAIRQAEKALIDADLGGGVIKQRLARKGQGKSGGYRSIVLFRRGERAFFAYGFARKDQANYQAGRIEGLPEACGCYARPRRRVARGRPEERNDRGDQMPWVSSTRATHWRPCMRPPSA